MIHLVQMLACAPGAGPRPITESGRKSSGTGRYGDSDRCRAATRPALVAMNKIDARPARDEMADLVSRNRNTRLPGLMYNLTAA